MGGDRKPNLSHVVLYCMLLEQIRLHDTYLQSVREKARSTLRTSTVVLGIMVVGMGNFVLFLYGGYSEGAEAYEALPGWSIAIISVYGITSLVYGARSIYFAMRAIHVVVLFQPTVYSDFTIDGKMNLQTVKDSLNETEEVFYLEMIEACIGALRSREEEARRVGNETKRSQTSLQDGPVFAAIGVAAPLAIIVGQWAYLGAPV